MSRFVTKRHKCHWTCQVSNNSRCHFKLKDVNPRATLNKLHMPYLFRNIDTPAHTLSSCTVVYFLLHALSPCRALIPYSAISQFSEVPFPSGQLTVSSLHQYVWCQLWYFPDKLWYYGYSVVLLINICFATLLFFLTTDKPLPVGCDPTRSYCDGNMVNMVNLYTFTLLVCVFIYSHVWL